MADHDQREGRGHCRAGYALVGYPKNRDLTGTLIADIVLQLLSYVAQTEREFIHQRQAQGVRLGRPPLAQPKEFPAVHQAWLKKEISAREAAWRLSVTHKTFLRRAQKL